MKKIIALSVFAVLAATLTGCYGHGPLKDLRSGKADKEAQTAQKQAAKKAAPAKAAPAEKKAASAKTAPAK